jgi:large subunit ribosomal protein L24
MSFKIRKGDKVQLMRGKDKGKTGKVLEINFAENRAIVEGLNLVKKHMRRRSENEPGGIKDVPSPIKLSNIALFCPNCSRGRRVAVKRMEDKSRLRVCKKCQQPIQ